MDGGGKVGVNWDPVIREGLPEETASELKRTAMWPPGDRAFRVYIILKYTETDIESYISNCLQLPPERNGIQGRDKITDSTH